jgi:hypothetical protein
MRAPNFMARQKNSWVDSGRQFPECVKESDFEFIRDLNYDQSLPQVPALSQRDRSIMKRRPAVWEWVRREKHGGRQEETLPALLDSHSPADS